jgi:hypothetical protein
MAEPNQQQGLGSLVITTLQNGVVAINSLVQAIKNVFPTVTGSFTLAAAASTVVTQPAIRATSVIQLSATNAAAATLQGSAKALYYTLTPGTGFTVFTANAGAAAGSETFSYSIFNPS